jgi:chorismate synthase
MASGVRFLTAGESHGKAIVVIVEGLPAGIPVDQDELNRRMARRQGGYGRGGRMNIERDRAEVLSGVRHGRTLGSPIALLVANRDWENWREEMSSSPVEGFAHKSVTAPRPGHADLAGGMKYGTKDFRNIIERASARETAGRVAAGALAASFLDRMGVAVDGLVESVGGRAAEVPSVIDEVVLSAVEASPFRSPDPRADEGFRGDVDGARERGDTLGGVFLIVARGVVPGIGSHVQWDRRLDGRLAAALMSIPGVKGVEVGIGFGGSALGGHRVHDEIITAPPGASLPWRFVRRSNNAGGIEGGMSNGEDILVRSAMKPIPTTRVPLKTVDVVSGEVCDAHHERSDVTAVPAAAVVGEAMVALVLADGYLEKFGGDTVEEAWDALECYRARLASY